MPRILPSAIKELTEADFGWRSLEPYEYGWQRPEHVCNRHCVAGRERSGTRRIWLRHPQQGPGDDF